METKDACQRVRLLAAMRLAAILWLLTAELVLRVIQNSNEYISWPRPEIAEWASPVN